MLSLFIFMFPCSLNRFPASDPTLLSCLEPLVHILLLSLAMGSLSIVHILQSKFQKRRMGNPKGWKGHWLRQKMTDTTGDNLLREKVAESLHSFKKCAGISSQSHRRDSLWIDNQGSNSLANCLVLCVNVPPFPEIAVNISPVTYASWRPDRSRNMLEATWFSFPPVHAFP